MAGINIFTLMGSVMVDTKKAEDSIQKTESKASKLAGALGNGLKTAAKWGAGIAAGAGVAAGALLQVDNATKEYRENMNKLTTAFEATGKSSDMAKDAYTEFYKILGDQDTATEATQLLSNLVSTEQDVANWTNISAGVMGRFGDALPIEGLIEAANETAKVGKITGVLADALNWAGISEDEFNEKLATCSTEQERNALITETLTETYKGSTEAFNENNAEIMAARENQAKLDESMGKLGEAVGKIKSKFVGEFTPSISGATDALARLLEGDETAAEDLQENIQNMINKGMEMLPMFVEIGLKIIGSIGVGFIEAIPDLVKNIPEMVEQIVEALLKMGGALWEAGKELFNEFMNGLTSKAQSNAQKKIESGNYSRRGQSVDVDGRHATGLSYVPHDNYIAALHKGEEVVSAADKQGILDILKAMALGNSNGQPVNINLVVDSHVLSKVLYDPMQNESKLRGTSIVQGVA